MTSLSDFRLLASGSSLTTALQRCLSFFYCPSFLHCLSLLYCTPISVKFTPIRQEMEIPLEGWLNVLEALISSDCDEEALSLFNRMRGSAESMRSNGKLLHVQTASGTRTRIPPADLTCYNAMIRGFARRG